MHPPHPTYDDRLFLLAAPSFFMPSHPVSLPATSSALPYPLAAGSRFSVAARIDACAWALSCSPDVVQAWEPVTLPTVLFLGVVSFGRMGWDGMEVVAGGCALRLRL